MRWGEVVQEVRYSNPRVLAAVMAHVWRIAAESADDGRLFYMTQQLDPYGVVINLDHHGIDVPPEVLALLPPPRRPLFISIQAPQQPAP